MKSKKPNIRKYLDDCKKYANAFASCLSQNDQGHFWEAWHLVESSENQKELQKRTEVIDELTKSLITRYEQSILESRKEELRVWGREIRWTFEQILDEIDYLDVIQYCLYHKNEKKATYEPFSDEDRFSFAEGMYFHMFPTPAKRKEWEEYAQGDAILDFPELCEFLLNSNVPLLYRGLIAFSAVDIMYHSPQNVEFLKNYGKEMFMPMSKYTMIDGNGYTAEEEYWREGGNTGMLPQRITPSQVNVLKNKEIFVFGSNFEGKHIGGAAFAAYKKFGAIYGVGEGLQGHSYALPTTDGIDNLRPAVERFTLFAKQHKELTFYVTAIGCGNAGYKPEEVAPLFLEVALRCGNVNLPLSF